MVICSFFLKGQCRFGDSCKNEHSYNSPNSSSVLLKKPDVDLNALVKSASGDMQKAEKGNQWPLSCYGPYQAKPCFPGFEDKCFEEIRLGFYEAQRNGNLEQYKVQLSQLLEETRMKIKSLQNPTPEATNMLKEIYYSNTAGNQQKSIFGTPNSNSIFSNSTPQQNSIFGNSTQNSIFGNTIQPNSTPTQTAGNFSFALPENKSIFGNTQPTVQSQPFQSSNSIFGNPTNQNTFQSKPGIFGGMTQQPTAPAFGQSAIFQTPIPPTPSNHSASIFGNSSSNNAFSGTQTNTFSGTSTNTFGSTNSSQSIFGSNANTVQPASTNQSIFGASPFSNAPQTTSIFPQSPFTKPDNPPTNVNPFLANSQSNVSTPFFNNTTANVNTPLLPTPVFNSDKPQSHSASIFGNRTAQTASTVKKDDPSVYSKISDLNANDISQYEKQGFDFGSIPTRAPALEMC